MGDTGDDFRAWRDYKRERKAKYGIACPGCNIKEPKREPTIMLPGMKCRVCGYVDRRPSIPHGGKR